MQGQTQHCKKGILVCKKGKKRSAKLHLSVQKFLHSVAKVKFAEKHSVLFLVALGAVQDASFQSIFLFVCMFEMYKK